MVKTFLAMAVVLVLVGYNNCSRSGMSELQFDASSMGGNCDSLLSASFEKDYWPFLKTNCAACHVSGPGLGSFSNNDLGLAFSAFKSIGESKISSQAANPNHKPPYTGSHHTSSISGMKEAWALAVADYDSCRAKAGDQTSYAATTIEKQVPVSGSTLEGAWGSLLFDFDSDLVSGKLPVYFSIEFRYYRNQLGELQGYEFRNPAVKLKNSLEQVEVKSLWIRINGEKQTQATTYSNIHDYLKGTKFVLLSENSSSSFVYRPNLSSEDNLSFSFESFHMQPATTWARTGNYVPTPSIDKAEAPTMKVTYADLMGNNASLNVFATSCAGCHGVNGSGGLNITSYSAARSLVVPGNPSASEIYRRMIDGSRPMPTSGVLPPDRVELVRQWILNGAPK